MDARRQLMLARFSRRTALKAAGIGAAGFTLAQKDLIRSMAQESDEIQDILNITATTEQFGVTFLGEGLAANAAGLFDQPWPDIVVAVITAARAQEQFHLDAFLELGGEPLTDTFTVPEESLVNFEAFFRAVTEQEVRETASQIAAMETFTREGRVDLAKVSYQYAAEEAEHRLLANYTRGARPANDRAFAHDPYESIDEFLAELEELGIIGGEGVEITYPGPNKIDASLVTNTEPDGEVVDCAPQGGASPVAEDQVSPIGGGTTTTGDEDEVDADATPEEDD